MALRQREREKVGDWRFNEVIGFLRLHSIGSQVRAEHFSAEKKRTPIGSRNKVFLWQTWKFASEDELPQRGSNAEICRSILDHVAACASELPKGRVLDTSMLEAVGPFVDWAASLGGRNQRPRS